MAPDLDGRIAAITPRNLAGEGESVARPLKVGGVNRARYGETAHHSPVDHKKILGRCIDRALDIAKIERKALAGLLGYADDSPVYRWIAGVDSPPMSRLLLIPAFAAGFLIAVPEIYAHERISAEYAVRVRFPA